MWSKNSSNMYVCFSWLLCVISMISVHGLVPINNYIIILLLYTGCAKNPTYPTFTLKWQLPLLHPFNGLFSSTRKEEPFWILMKQEMMGGNGNSWTIFKWLALCSRDNHTSTSSFSFIWAGCFSFCPTNSVKALKAMFSSTNVCFHRMQMTATWISVFWAIFVKFLIRYRICVICEALKPFPNTWLLLFDLNTGQQKVLTEVS